MLYLHQSNQLERLAHHFAALQRIDPLPPFQDEVVVVQNSGMGRWLSLQAAKVNGIAANARYLFPAEIMWEMLRAVLENVPERDPGAAPLLRWRLFKEFVNAPEQWTELSSYLATGIDGAWQLANQIAKVFDAYLFFRPEWIREWEDNEGSGVDWQARLWWQMMGAPNLTHWVRLQNQFKAQLALHRDKLPKRICYFSVPILSPGYVELLGEIAQYIDIHIYLMNPSEEYWSDIVSEKRKYKRELAEQEHVEVGNPLLASWGRQGQDFMDLLLNANANDDETSLFVSEAENSLLKYIQADILHLRMPSPHTFPLTDDSIRIHSCHSPMREVEVLYDQLLALFECQPDLTPADVVVMTPDIDKYAPYLEAVFANAEYPLPFSIADSHAGKAQSLLNLCEQLLALPQGRCEVESILAVLEFEEVRTHLGMDENQTLQCREWIRAANIRWGVDSEARAQLGGAATPEHTWRYGLDRLLLGYMLPGDDLFADVLPYEHIEGSQAEVLGELLQVLDVLLAMSQWQYESLSLADWRARLTAVLVCLVGETAALQPIWAAFDKLKLALQHAAFDELLAWPVLQNALSEHLEQRSESDGFLGRGITFCALMPMRTVPFRFVAIIGMNDGIFPRRDVYASFNRMAYSIHKGDRIKRNEDRYLFLESLLSARQWFYLSYVGQSLHDNAVLPPSVLVSELQDYIARIHPDFSRQHFIQHRLQAFSKPYLQADAPFFTYSAHLAETQNTQYYCPVEFWQNNVLPEPEQPSRKVNLQQLIRFFQQPARLFLNERFQLKLGEQNYELPNREPFDLARFQDGEIRGRIYQALIRDKSPTQVLSLLRAEGHLPHGELGDLLFKQELQNTERFYQQYGAPPSQGRKQAFHLALEDFELVGELDKIVNQQRVLYELNYLSYWQWLDIWLKHLVLSALGHESTIIYGIEKDEDRQFTLAGYQLAPYADALNQLQQLLQLYWQGLQAPLPFFPKTGFNLASRKKEQTVEKVMSTWEGKGQFKGEKNQAEYVLFYHDTNPLIDFKQDFTALTTTIYQPLMTCRSALANKKSES